MIMKYVKMLVRKRLSRETVEMVSRYTGNESSRDEE